MREDLLHDDGEADPGMASAEGAAHSCQLPLRIAKMGAKNGDLPVLRPQQLVALFDTSRWCNLATVKCQPSDFYLPVNESFTVGNATIR